MLSQNEADELFLLAKKAQDAAQEFRFPSLGSDITVPIVSLDNREAFLLDVNRSRMILAKCTYMERYKTSIVLARLDVAGPPHTNPSVTNAPVIFANYNGAEIACPHLHLYVEGYDAKWAMPAPVNIFDNTTNLHSTLEGFLTYCNVVEPPAIGMALLP